MRLVADFFYVPLPGRGVWCIWQRNFLYFRYSLWVSVLWVIVEPILYLLAIGYGLGTLVGEVQGLPYVEFFIPALMVISAMLVVFFESTYSTYTKLTRQKTFDTVLLTPVGPDEIALGEMLWAASKGLLSAVGVALVGWSQGLIDPQMILPALGVVALMCWVFAAIGLIFTSLAKNYDWFLYAQTIFIMPMYLFAGTYFPLEVLPPLVRDLALALPLTHAVMAVRSILGGDFQATILVNVAVLFGMAVLATNFAVSRFRRKLIG